MAITSGSVVSYARSYVQWEDAGGQKYTDTELWALAGDTESAFVANFVAFLANCRASSNAKIGNAYLEFVNRYPIADSSSPVVAVQSVVSAAYGLAEEKANTIRGTGKFRVVFPIPAFVQAKLFTSDTFPWDSTLNTADTDVAAILTFLNTHIAIREPVTGSLQTGFLNSVKDSGAYTLDDIIDNN